MRVMIEQAGGSEEVLARTLREQLMRAARALLKEHGREQGEVAIILAGDSYLQELNRRFRGLDAPTDVLAFRMEEPAAFEKLEAEKEGAVALGDIYISLDRARDQAAAAGSSFEREVLTLAIHGLLHLLGYDHDSAAAAEIMKQRETDLLLGLENSG